MRNIKIAGYGAYLPENTVMFGDNTRYWCANGETQLDLAENACKEALANANLSINDIDCIVAASAVGVQPIPCTAALIHERIAKGTSIPAFDINSTCTSFVTALDTMSYLIAAGRYNRVMIVASDISSLGLNVHQRTSYELFSDGACTFIIERSDDDSQGIIGSMQKTWSEGAHFTEIRGGLSAKIPKYYSEETYDDFYFDMDGKKVLSLVAKKLPDMMEEFMSKFNTSRSDINLIVPHQASRVLPFIMKSIGITEEQFVNHVKDYGNQVSVSIPYMLYLSLKNGRVKQGDTVFLIGTAAGLTTNMLLMRI